MKIVEYSRVDNLKIFKFFVLTHCNIHILSLKLSSTGTILLTSELMFIRLGAHMQFSVDNRFVAILCTMK